MPGDCVNEIVVRIFTPNFSRCFMRPEPEPLTLPLVSASRASDAPEEPTASANGQEGAPADGEQDERAGDDCCILCTPGVNTPPPSYAPP